MVSALENSESAILSRAIDPLQGHLTPEVAQQVLQLQLAEPDREAATKLAEQAKKGTLTPDQQVQLESYRRAGRILELLKSKARLALKTANSGS